MQPRPKSWYSISLFTDPSLPAEYDSAATETLWHRVLALLAGLHGESLQG
jgi:hypothetical protein